MHRNHLLCSLILCSSFTAARAAPPELRTAGERSGYLRTGRYDEVERLCAAFPLAFPGRVRCEPFARTPEGRPMLALVASADGALTPALAQQRRRPVLLFQGGIHAGEIDGKDAGFALLRDLLQGRLLPGALGQVTVVFVPVFNVDGHERFGRSQRPNQIGPEESGWRTTAQNLNLNRDYAKAEAPEMAAMLRLLTTWDPIFYADLHVTDGAKFQQDVAVLIEPQLAGPKAMAAQGRAAREELMGALTRQGHLPVWFYPSFERDDDPSSGFAAGVAPPRFSYGYWPLRNRFAALVETHSWRDYRARVRATYDVMAQLLRLTARDGARWLEAARAADQEDLALSQRADRPGQEVPLRFDNTEASRLIDFQGYAYVREPSAISGGLRVRYDTSKPQPWRVPLREELKVVSAASPPGGGYLVPPAFAGRVAEKLRSHGLRYRALTKAQAAELSVFRIAEKRFRPGSFEGRQVVEVKGAWRPERRELPAGTIFIPIDQRGGRLLMHLLEPDAPDALLAWGFFNAVLEQKEYMEAYVAEAEAERMLAADPRLREIFAQRLLRDPAFAQDPAARLRFFHQRHPSWDERLDLYPVYRAPAGFSAPMSALRSDEDQPAP